MSSSDRSPLLEVRGLCAAWGGVPVLREIALTVPAGELFVLLGPNGSGKTTFLRCLAGLERPSAGSVHLDGVDITGHPAHRRGVALMFQDPALFPHRSVYENIAYAPLVAKRPRPEVDAEVDRLVELLHLHGYEDRRPDQLSGGERQRVALARTLAARPRLILLDEPFASIDVELKSELRSEFHRVLRESGTTAIHVTHDREEGLFLADRVGLLFDGRLQLPGRPADLYANPRSARAARFLGYNVLPGPSGPVGVLPSDVTLRPDGDGLRATVVASGSVGRETVVVLRTDDGHRAEAQLPEGAPLPSVDARVRLSWTRSVELRPDESERPKEPKNAR